MEPFTLILAAVLAQTTADTSPPPPPPPALPAGMGMDGTISRQDYVARFDRMDTNRDGILSREERRAAMPRGGGRRHGPGDGRRPDAGASDREIDRATFIVDAGKRFDRLDTDRNGRLDPAERRAGRARHRGPRGDAPPPPATMPANPR